MHVYRKKKKTCELPQVTVSARFAHVTVSKNHARFQRASLSLDEWTCGMIFPLMEQILTWPLILQQGRDAQSHTSVKPQPGSYTLLITQNSHTENKTQMYRLVYIKISILGQYKDMTNIIN